MVYIKVTDNNDVYADGIHDDTKALQSCIDLAKDGGTVYFPDGTYLISASLIFYSDQTLKFSDNARILRSDKSSPATKYLLASYSESQWGGYEGTHNVTISGGIFDGNENLTEKLTILNTVHCSNITIENCRFVNCAHWHCIEINGTENATVKNCFFNGPSYTVCSDQLLNELLQLDLARDGSYGPVYNCDGTLIEFKSDDTPCSNITIKNNIFKCGGFPGIGHHGEGAHNNITIRNNIFDGPSGSNNQSRGYVIFKPAVYNVKVTHNVFFAPENPNNPNNGIIAENPDNASMTVENNTFKGTFTDYFIGTIIEKNNTFYPNKK